MIFWSFEFVFITIVSDLQILSFKEYFLFVFSSAPELFIINYSYIVIQCPWTFGPTYFCVFLTYIGMKQDEISYGAVHI